MISKLSFSLWFIFGYVAFLMICMLIAVYGYDVRVGMEMQRYSALFAVEIFSIWIMISAAIAGAGFFVGVLLSDCRRGAWLGIVLGISYAAFVLFSMVFVNNIGAYLGRYASILICVLWFFGGFMLPIFVNIEQLTKKHNNIE